MSEGAAILIHRLSDLDDWEFYEVTPPGEKMPSPGGVTSLTIGLRPYTEFREVEYEVWDDGADEPRLTGSVPCDAVGDRWTVAAREPIVEEIFNQVRNKE